jgi:hypothetical protein
VLIVIFGHFAGFLAPHSRLVFSRCRFQLSTWTARCSRRFRVMSKAS